MGKRANNRDFADDGTGACGGPKPCTQDSECQEPSACINGTCAWVDPNKCRSDEACKKKNPATPRCDSQTGQCHACFADLDCKDGFACVEKQCQRKKACESDKDCIDAGLKRCNTRTKQCSECAENAHCSAPAAICSAEGRCVACNNRLDCKPGEECVNSTCQPAIRCAADRDCTDTNTPYCSLQMQRCVVCDNNGHCQKGFDCVNNRCERKATCNTKDDCVDAGAPHCNTTSKACVACLTKDHCSAPTAFCAPEGRCVGCNQRADCKAGEDCVNSTCQATALCASDRDCTDQAAPYCSLQNKRCVVCDNNGHCQKGFDCVNNRCERKATCNTNDECIDAGLSHCDLATHKCVACLANTHCSAPKAYCHTDKTCVSCASNTDCTDQAKPRCNKSEGICQACLGESDCQTGQVCVGGACQKRTDCRLDTDCVDAKLKYCEMTAKLCVECLGEAACQAGYTCKSNVCVRKENCANDKDCIDQGKGLCNPKDNKCVGCISRLDCASNQACVNGACANWCSVDAHCTDPTKPACQVATGQCVACVSHQDCPAGEVCNTTTSTCQAGAACGTGCPTGQVCETTSQKCVGCLANTDCPSTPSGKSKQACDTTEKQCIECAQNTDCKINQICQNKRCISGCASQQDCTPGLLCLKATGAATGVCGKCLKNADCPTGQICNPTSFICGSCADDTDCQGNQTARWCDPSRAVCTTGCSTNQHCLNNAAGAICDPQRNVCVACLATSDCPRGQHCEPLNNRCVACLENDAHCPSGQICNGFSCVVGCSTDTECALQGAGLLCASGRCRECDASRPCPNGKICDNKGQCSECGQDSDCSAGKFCDLSFGRCVPQTGRTDCMNCVNDTDCAVGYKCTQRDIGFNASRTERVCLKSCTKDAQCTGYQISGNPAPTQAPSNCTLVKTADRTYFFCNTSLTWDNASAECRKHGGYLVTLNDAQEHNFVVNEGNKWLGGYYWIGLRYRSGAFSWEDTSSSFRQWCYGSDTNPYNSPASYYDGVYMGGSCFYNQQASYTRRYVCEFDGGGGPRGYSCDLADGLCKPRWGGGSSSASSCRSQWTRGQHCERDTKDSTYSNRSTTCGLNSQKNDGGAYESYCSAERNNRCLMMCSSTLDCPLGYSCDIAQKQCIKECTANKDCDGGETCNTATQKCAECLQDSHCPSGRICKADRCVVGECKANKDCAGGLTCTNSRCRECAANTDCPGGRKCDSIGRCVRCLVDTDCAASGQTCDKVHGTCYLNQARTSCMPCQQDSDCSALHLCTERVFGDIKEKVCTKRCVQDSDCPDYDTTNKSSRGYFCNTTATVPYCAPLWSSQACGALWTDRKPCKDPSACGASSGVCSSEEARCNVGCGNDRQCPSGYSCKYGACTKGCTGDADCNGIQKCHTSLKLCVSCLANADCKDPENAVCDTQQGRCVPCVTDAECLSKDPLKPVCEYDSSKGKNQCRIAICLADSNCKTGEKCEGGRCRACSATNPCATGVCSPKGQCVQCNQSSDCKTGEACESNRCFPTTSRTACMSCQADSDCASDHKCVLRTDYASYSGRSEKVCLKTCTSTGSLCAEQGYVCHYPSGFSPTQSYCVPMWGGGYAYNKMYDVGSCASLWTAGNSCQPNGSRSTVCGLGSTSSSYGYGVESYCSANANEGCLIACQGSNYGNTNQECPSGMSCSCASKPCRCVAGTTTPSVDLLFDTKGFAVPMDATQNLTFQVEYIMMNVGKDPSPGYDVEIILALDKDLKMPVLTLHIQTHKGLGPSLTEKLTIGLVIKEKPGAYYIGFRIDPKGLVTETDEANNLSVWPISVK